MNRGYVKRNSRSQNFLNLNYFYRFMMSKNPNSLWQPHLVSFKKYTSMAKNLGGGQGIFWGGPKHYMKKMSFFKKSYRKSTPTPHPHGCFIQNCWNTQCSLRTAGLKLLAYKQPHICARPDIFFVKVKKETFTVDNRSQNFYIASLIFCLNQAEIIS